MAKTLFATQIVSAVREVSPGTLTDTAANGWLEQPTVSSIITSTAQRHIIRSPLKSWNDPMTFGSLVLSPVWRHLEHHF